MNPESSSFDESLLTAYLDNELSPSERERVEAALENSLPLRQLLADLAHVRALVVQCQVPSQALEKSFRNGPWNDPQANSVAVSPTLPEVAPKLANGGQGPWLYRHSRLLASLAAGIAILLGVGGLLATQYGSQLVSLSTSWLPKSTPTASGPVSSGMSAGLNSDEPSLSERAAESFPPGSSSPISDPSGSMGLGGRLQSSGEGSRRSPSSIAPPDTGRERASSIHDSVPMAPSSPLALKQEDAPVPQDPSMRYSSNQAQAAVGAVGALLPSQEQPSNHPPLDSPSELPTNMFFAYLNDVNFGEITESNSAKGLNSLDDFKEGRSDRKDKWTPLAQDAAPAESVSESKEAKQNSVETKLLWFEAFRGPLVELQAPPGNNGNTEQNNVDFMKRWDMAGAAKPGAPDSLDQKTEKLGKQVDLSPSTQSAPNEGVSSQGVAPAPVTHESAAAPVGSVWVYAPSSPGPSHYNLPVERELLQEQSMNALREVDPVQESLNRLDAAYSQRSSRGRQNREEQRFNERHSYESPAIQNKMIQPNVSRGGNSGANQLDFATQALEREESTIVLLIPVDRWDEAIRVLGQRGFPVENLQSSNQQNRAALNNTPVELFDEFIAEWNDPQSNKWKISRGTSASDSPQVQMLANELALSKQQLGFERGQSNAGAPEIAFRRLIIKIRNRAGKSSSNE